MTRLDRDNLVNEINEFFSSQDIGVTNEGKILFHNHFKKKWTDSTSSSKKEEISYLLDQLEINDPDVQKKNLNMLLYIAQGVFDECPTIEEHVESLKVNNKLLLESGAFGLIYQNLRLVSHEIDGISKGISGSGNKSLLNNLEEAINQMSILLSLIYLMVEVNIGSFLLAEKLVYESKFPFAAFLFNMIVQLAEGNRKHYPVKKLLVLLWKVLLASVGETEQLKRTKKAARQLEKLKDLPEDLLKCGPSDYQSFCETVTCRYPSYVVPDLSGEIESSAFLTKTFNLKKSSSQTLPLNVQPFSDTSSNIPFPIAEATAIYQRNLYVSLAETQSAREAYGLSTTGKHWNLNCTVTNTELFLKTSQKHMAIDALEIKNIKRIEKLYSDLLPNFPAYVGMLVRLLYYVNLGNSQSQHNVTFPEKALKSAFSPQVLGKLVHLETLEFERQKEIISKSVSAIMKVLLCSIGLSNTFCFEYLSQLLVDNNGAILILKILSAWYQIDKKSNQIPDWLLVKPTVPEMNFFNFCRQSSTDYTVKFYESGIESYKNYFTSVNLMLVLHKMTRGKTHRILSLVQWKSCAVLKKVARVNHPGLQYYALKLMKSQIPYLGRKWRLGNMKIITLIYLILKPKLKEDFLLGNIEPDNDEALAQEQQLRQLIKNYHQRNYPNIFESKSISKEKSDDLESMLKMLKISDSNQKPLEFKSHLLNFDLDEHFLQNWEAWLDHEVYNTHFQDILEDEAEADNDILWAVDNEKEWHDQVEDQYIH